MTTFTLAVAVLLLIAILSNPIYAVIGVAILFQLYPYATTGILLVAGIAYFIYRRYV
jgi:hypothetical protein